MLPCTCSRNASRATSCWVRTHANRFLNPANVRFHCVTARAVQGFGTLANTACRACRITDCKYFTCIVQYTRARVHVYCDNGESNGVPLIHAESGKQIGSEDAAATGQAAVRRRPCRAARAAARAAAHAASQAMPFPFGRVAPGRDDPACGQEAAAGGAANQPARALGAVLRQAGRRCCKGPRLLRCTSCGN